MPDLDPVTARRLADVVLVAHALFVLFVVMGQLAILLGWCRGWGWTRHRWFRILHLSAIGVVVAQAWAGMVCPLTGLEDALRRAHGVDGYRGVGFIAYWLQVMLYWRAPAWVFTTIYTLFAGVVAFSYWRYPPYRRSRSRYNSVHDRGAEQ